MKRLKALGVVLAIQMLIPAQMMLAWTPNNRGAEGSPGSVQSNSAGQAGQSVPLNLDLASTEASVAASLANSVNVNVGGAMKTINPGDLVTPAEFVAAYQVMNGGNQRLHLGADGNAIAGRMSLTGLGQIGDLVVPASVRVLQDFSSSQLVNLAGNLTNAGKFVAFSNSPAVNAGELAANNITNSGTVASYLASFTMSALGNLVNTGTVTGTGNLTMSAGGTLTNMGLVSAGGDLNMLTANVVNAGMLQSLNGNINLNTVMASNIIVNNIGGTFEALKGAINVRELASNDMKDLTMVGGNYLSKELNLNSCGGTVELRTDDLTGQLNIKAAVAHTFSSTDTLTLGNLDLSGDPTFYNLGDININGPISVGQDLAIVAEGNITATSATAKLVANDGALNGANILVIAGADIDTTNCPSCVTTGQSGFAAPIPNQVGATESIDVDLTAGPGGNINFSASTEAIVIDSSAIGADAMGGDVILVAHANGATGGRVTLPGGGAVNANGTGTGANGNVRIFAGANSGTGITLGSVNANAGSGGGGVVTVFTTQAVTNDSMVLTLDENGQISSGNLVVPGAMTNSNIVRASGTLTANEVQLASGSGAIGSAGSRIATDAPNVNVNTTGNVFLSSTRAAGVSINAPSTAANFQMISSGTISVDGTLTASGVLTMQTLAGSNGSINVNAGVSGANGVTMTTDGTGSVAVAAATAILTTNSALTLIANDVQLNATGTLSAGSSTVTLRPNGNKAISVGTGATGFGVSQTEMNNITAGTLAIGSTGNTGGLTIDGAVDVSLLYNLSLNNGGTYTGSGQTITIGANDLTVTATSGASSTTGAVTGTSGSAVTFTVGGGLSVDGTLNIGTSSTLSLTANGGNIGLADNLIADEVSLNAFAHITYTAGTITAPTSVSLTAGGNAGDVGPGNFLVLNTPELTFSAGGKLIVQNAQTLDIMASTAGNQVSVETNGDLNVLGAISGTSVALVTLSGSNGTIDVGANVTSTSGPVSLAADGTGSIVHSAGLISATTLLHLEAGGDIGTLGNEVNASAQDLQANTTGGDVYINVTGATDLNASSGNNFVLTATGLLTVSGAVTAGLDLSLTGVGVTTQSSAVLNGNNVTVATNSNGNIILNDDINATVTVLNANGSGMIQQNAGSINTLSLSLTSGSANITGIDTNATTIQANTTGDVALTATGPVTLLASTGNDFTLDAAGNLTVNGLLNTTGDVSLTTTAGNGDIQLNVNVNGANIELIANGSGNIAQANTGLLLNTPGALDMSSGTGNIGTALVPIQTNASAISAQTTPPGSVWINSQNTNPVDIGPMSGVNLEFDAAGTVNVVGFLNFTNMVDIANTAGDIAIGANITGTNSVLLNAFNGITRTAGTVTGSAVTLTAGAASVGADVMDERVVVETSAGGLTITASMGSAYVDEETGLLLHASSVSAAGDLFVRNLALNQDITTDGVLTGGQIRLTTLGGAGSFIALGADVTGTNEVRIDAGDGISQSGGTVSAPDVALIAQAGDVGAVGLEIDVDAGSALGKGLSIQADMGNAYVNETDGLNLKASSADGDLFVTQINAGVFNVTGTVSADDVRLTMFNNGGVNDFSIGGNIIGDSNLEITSDKGIVRSGSFTLTSANLDLTANNGFIGSFATRILTAGLVDTDLTLATPTSGSAYIEHTNGVGGELNIQATTGINGDLFISTLNEGDMNVDGLLSADDVRLTTFATGSGNIALNAGISGATQVVLSADGSITRSAGTIVTGLLDMTATQGSIGANAAGQKIVSSLGTLPGQGLTISAPAGSAYVEETDGIRINASTTLNDFFVNTTGGVGTFDVVGTIQGGKVQFTTFATGGGNINLDADVTGTTEVILSADASITQASGTVAGGVVSLTAATGDIGVFGGGEINTNAGHAMGEGLDVHAPAGNAYVDELNSVRLNASNVATNFYLTTQTAGAVTVTVVGAITGMDLRIQNNNGANIHLLNSITGGNQIVLNAGGSITNGVGATSLLSADAIQLVAEQSIGANVAGEEIYTNAATTAGNGLEMRAVNGSMYIKESNSVRIRLAENTSQTGDVFVDVINSGGTMTIDNGADRVLGGNIRLTTIDGPGGDIVMGSGVANVHGAMSVFMHSGFFLDNTAGGSIVAPNIDLESAVDIGSGAFRVLTNAGSGVGEGLSVSASNGSAWILEADAVNVKASLVNPVTGQFFLDQNAAGNLNVTGLVQGNLIQFTTFTGGGSDINLDAGITATFAGALIDLTADGSITRSAGTLTSAEEIMLTATTGSVGTTGNHIEVDAGNLVGQGITATADDNVFVHAVNSTRFQTSVATTGEFVASVDGDMTVEGTITAGTTVDLSTSSGFNGSITLNDSVMGGGEVTISADGNGNFTLAAGKSVTSGGNPISIFANDVLFGGVGAQIDALGSMVTLSPNGDGKSIEVAGAGSATFNVSSAELANVRAGVLQIGDTDFDGGFTVAGGIDVTGAGPFGVYNLIFENGGNYTAAGQTILTGFYLLGVTAGGTVDTGTVTATTGNITFTAGNTMTVSGDLTTGGVGLTQLIVNDNDGNMVLNGDVGGGVATFLTVTGDGDISQLAGKTVSGDFITFLAGDGIIGSNQAIDILTSGLQSNSSGNVFLNSTGSGNLTFDGNTTANNFTLTTQGNVYTSGENITADGTLTIQTLANDGEIVFTGTSGTIEGGTGVNLITNGLGQVAVGDGLTVKTLGNSPITVTANDINIQSTGFVDAGTGLVTLQPNGAKSIEVAGAGGATFNLSSAEMVNITAGTLQVGTTGQAGGFTVAGNIDVSGAGPAGVYNLAFYNGGSYTGTGFTVTLGTKFLDVIALDTVNTGNVVSTSGSISFQAGNTLTVDADVTTTTGQTTLLTSMGSNGSILLDNNVGGGALTIVNADGTGTITQTNGKLLSGTSVDLVSDDGDIGTSGNFVDTHADSLTLNTDTASVFVNNDQAVSLGASTVGADLNLTASGSISTTSLVSANNVLLEANSGSAGGINLGANLSGTTSVTLNADGAGNIDGDGNTILTTTLDMNSGSGNIGTALDPIKTNADFVTTSTTGQVHVQITGSTQIGPASGSVLSFSATDDITTGGMITATDTLTIKTTANDGSITISHDASGVNGVTIQTNGAGNFTVDSGATVSSGSESVSVEANDVSLSAGFVSAANDVLLIPNGTKSISVGGAGGTFTVLQTDLNVISAGFVRIGDLLVGGGLTIAGPVSITNFDLGLRNAGTYTGTGQTITVNNHSVNIQATGVINTGAITGTTADLFITGGNAINVDGNVVTTGTQARVMTTVGNNADIAFSANFGTTADETEVVVHGTGNITRTAGSISGATVTLTAADGDIGASAVGNRVATTATNLVLDSAGGNVYVINTGNVNLLSGSAGDGKTFSLEAQSGIDIQTNIEAQNVGDVIGLISLKASGSDAISNTGANTLTADAVELETVNGDIGALLSEILTNTDSLKLTSTAGNAFVINDGSLTLQASTIGGDMFLVTTGGGITTGGNINAANLVFFGNTLVNANTITATDGAGVFDMTGDTGLTVSGGGTVTAPGGVTFTATDNTLAFTGSQTFNGNAVLNGQGTNGLVSVTAGQSVHSNDDMIINACQINNPPPGFTADGTLTFNFTCCTGGGTIANSDGDVVLSSNLVIVGSAVAILASGNVIAQPGFTMIDLSSTTGQGGNLYIVAGFDFTPATAGQVTDTTTTFTLGSPSTTGGSVVLPGVSVNTSSTSAGFAGGSVVVVAHAGDDSDGVIQLGSINTSAVGNPGGDVTLIGQGGVTVSVFPGNAINTSGTQGGNVTIAGAEPTITGGTIDIFNGIKSGSGLFTADPPTAGAGATVLVDGAITTVGTSGNGGNLSITSDSTVQTVGDITTSGGTLGGHAGGIFVASLNNQVSLFSNITALGGNANSTMAAGNGGDLVFDVPAFASVFGNVLLSGGNNTGTGDGGVGGDFFATTALNTLGTTPRAFRLGTIAVTGYVDQQGGDSTGGNGGAGGDFVVNAGALTIGGANGGVSLNVSAGTGGTPGANGDVDIDTYSLQQLPINFMLTSINLSEIALAGGMFNVGNGTVNGTAGTIVSGANVATSANAGRILDTNPFALGGIEIDVTGPSSYTINLGGTPTVISVDAGAGTPRTQVTPGMALALYQVSRDSSANAQTIGLERKGKVTDKNPVTGLSPSVITINGQELPSQFTAFVVNTQSNKPGLTINVQGASPIFNVADPGQGAATNFFYINGDLVFTTANANANMSIGNNIFNMSKDGSFVMNGAGSLATFMGGQKQWTAQGMITAGGLIFESSTAMTFDMSTGGTLNGTGAGSEVAFISNGGNMQVKGGLKTGALVGTTLGAADANGTLTWTVSGTLNVADGGILESAGAMSLTPSQTGANVNIGDGSLINSGGSITIKGLDVTTGDDVSIVAAGGDLMMTANGNNGDMTIGFGNTLIAGTLSGLAPPPPAILSNADIVAAGGVYINAWKQNGVMTINSSLANPTTITSNGRDVSLIGGKTGIFTMGNNLTAQANGGNVIAVGGATVTGGTGMTFIATAVGNLASFTGGGVEIGAGETSSKNLVNTLKNRPATFTTVPNPLPPIGTFNLVPASPARGVLRADIKNPGVINIGTGVNPATLQINGGVIIFDGNKQNLTLIGPTIQVNAPVAFTTDSQSQGEMVVDTGDDCDQDIDDGTVSILP